MDLFDLARDPHQLDAAAGATDPARLAGLHAWLETPRTCAGAGCRAAEDGAAGE